MREVVIAIRCDLCEQRFTEANEGDNSVIFTVRGEKREMDLCDPCIGGSFLQEARPVKGKPRKAEKPFACHCGKSYTSQRGLSKHQSAAHD